MPSTLIPHVLLEFQLAGHRSQWNMNDLKVEKLLNAFDSTKFLLSSIRTIRHTAIQLAMLDASRVFVCVHSTNYDGTYASR